MTITINAILHNIQKRGSWIVYIRPSTFEKERLEIDDCLKIVLASQVSLRGWNYPHYHEAGTADGGISIGIDYVQCITDYKAHKEIWRMYQSGLFVHRFACEEDWWQETESENVLEIMFTLYRITEIYLFASRLAIHEVYDPKMKIAIELMGMEDRRLTVIDPRRNLDHEYKSSIYSLPHRREYSKAEIVANPSLYALEAMIWLFKRFNWQSPELREILKREQDKFLTGDIPM